VSAAKFVDEVNGNGSGLSVTDSIAIARVETDSLSRTGDLPGFAACTVISPAATAHKDAKITSLRMALGRQRGEPIVISRLSVTELKLNLRAKL